MDNSRFKFRGFDTTNKVMYQPVYFDNLEIWWWNPETDEQEILGDVHNDSMLIHVELMQSTGLKDRNGKMIFEGDIVKIDWGNPKILFYVKWYDADAGWRFHNDKKGGMGLAGCTNIVEVIGNILENPELMKGE